MKKQIVSIIIILVFFASNACFAQSYTSEYVQYQDSIIRQDNYFKFDKHQVIVNELELMVFHYEESTDPKNGTVSYYYHTELETTIIFTKYMDGRQLISMRFNRYDQWWFYTSITKHPN